MIGLLIAIACIAGITAAAAGGGKVGDDWAYQCDFDFKSLLEFEAVGGGESEGECGKLSTNLFRYLTEATAERKEFDGPLRIKTSCSKPKRRWRWMTGQEAASMIENIGHMVLLGDSMLRHQAAGLVSVAQGNYRYGATKWWFFTRDLANDPDARDRCQCDHQYGDGHYKLKPEDNHNLVHCRSYTNSIFYDRYSKYTTPGDPTMYEEWSYVFPRWQRNASINCFEDFERIDHDNFRGYLRSMPAGSRVNVIMGGGLHLMRGMPHSYIIDQLYRPYLPIIREFPNLSVFTVVATLPPPGANKNRRYYQMQNDDAVRAMNEEIKKFARENNIGAVFDRYACMKNADSWDGTHFSNKMNTLTAQLLIQGIADMRGLDYSLSDKE